MLRCARQGMKIYDNRYNSQNFSKIELKYLFKIADKVIGNLKMMTLFWTADGWIWGKF